MKALTHEAVATFKAEQKKKFETERDWLTKTFDYISRSFERLQPSRAWVGVDDGDAKCKLAGICEVWLRNGYIEIRSEPKGVHPDGQYEPEGFFSGDDDALYNRLLFELARCVPGE